MIWIVVSSSQPNYTEKSLRYKITIHVACCMINILLRLGLLFQAHNQTIIPMPRLELGFREWKSHVITTYTTTDVVVSRSQPNYTQVFNIIASYVIFYFDFVTVFTNFVGCLKITPKLHPSLRYKHILTCLYFTSTWLLFLHSMNDTKFST